jgi:hypothetical protein
MGISGTAILRYRQTLVSVNAANTDVAVFPGLPSKWRLRKLIAYDASTSLAASSATIGAYTAASGGGTNLVGLAVLTTLSSTTKCLDMTVVAAATTSYATASSCFIRCGIAHGSAATITVAIEIENLE